MYGCEIGLLTLWEEHRLRVSENRVLRRILERKRDGVAGEWRKLHEELTDLYSTPNIVWVIKSRRIQAGHVWGRGVYRVLTGKPEGKRSNLEDPGIWLRYNKNINQSRSIQA